MKIKRTNFLLSLGASIAVAMIAAPVFGQTVVVDDNVAVDGTASLDAQYFFSSSSNGLEINANSIGLVSGSSGRPIHGIFPAVTLTDIGDSITLSFTFMTPATVGTDEDDGIRIGLFDTLGRETPVLIDNPDFDPDDPNSPSEIQEVIDGVPQTEGVFGNIIASTSNPNPLYGDMDDPVNQPALPGFAIAYDVNDLSDGIIPDDEIQIRQQLTDMPSGRFLTANDGFEILADENALVPGNQVLGWAPNSMYSGFVTIERVSMTEAVITTFIDNLAGFPQPDMMGDPVVVSTRTEVNATPPDPIRLRDQLAMPDSFTFDLFAFQAGGGAFGSSNTPETPDNGLDFLSIRVETTGDVEETSLVGDFDGNGVVDCDDLDGYIGNIGADATGMLAALDFDGNGTLTGSDADMVIAQSVTTSNGVTGTFLGDVNCDGSVNVLGDAFALVGNLGASATMYSQGDLDFNGSVDVLGDAFILVGNLGMNNAAP